MLVIIFVTYVASEAGLTPWVSMQRAVIAEEGRPDAGAAFQAAGDRAPETLGE
jgi:hypothetical protein